MKKFFLCILLFMGVVAIRLKAQTESNPILSQRTIYAELYGSSLPISINYDSRFNEHSRWGYRTGIAYIRDWQEFELFRGLHFERISGINIPLEINCLAGREGTKNKLELGAGLNLGFYNEEIGYQEDYDIDNDIITSSNNMLGYFLFFNIGYRLQPRKGFLFRVGVTPIFDFGGKNGVANYFNIFMVLPSLSFGYAF